MQKTKRPLWLTAVLAAFLVAVAVAGCKHDEEDEWTPLTIRGTVFEKYAGQRKSVTIPDGVTGIGGRAFSGSDVAEVVIPPFVTSIAADAFADSNVTSVSYIGSQEDWQKLVGNGLPDGIQVACFIIENDILIRYEGDETDVVIPAGFVKGIAGGVFRDCAVRTGITGVTIPGSVKRIGENAFADCTALADVRIEAGVADIGAGAFAGCTALESLNIPAGVTGLGERIVSGCERLTELVVHESVTTIAADAFTGIGRKEITYRAKKAKWEKLVADTGIRQNLAGFTVHCTDGDWNGPAQGATTPGDNTGDTHVHIWSGYMSDGAGGHYQACKVEGCTARTPTETHVYDDEGDGECNKCGYRKEVSGDPDCEHELIIKYNVSGHYTNCTRCEYQSGFENHTCGEYENDGADGHRRNCTTAGCGYTETVPHDWNTPYTTDADKHYKTCKIAGCTARDGEGAHNYDGAPYKNDGNDTHHQNCTVCDYPSAPVKHTWGEYTNGSDGHDRTCTGCGHTEHLDHDWSEYTQGSENHTKTCTVTGTAHTEIEKHSYTMYKGSFPDPMHTKTCEACGYNKLESHALTYKYEDRNQHETLCTLCKCHKFVEHEYKYKEIDGDNHRATCKSCEYFIDEEHIYDDDSDAECNNCGHMRIVKPSPGSLPIEGGTLTIGNNGEVTGYVTGSNDDPVNVTIPDGVTGIEDGVFNKIWNLGTVTIPDSVDRIGANAFAGSGVQKVEINGVKDIGDNAFNGCYRLTDVTIADSTETIGNSAFQNCGSLETVTIPGSVTSIGDNAFDGCGLTSVTIADGVNTIGKEAFKDCEKLNGVAIPGSVTSIGDNAFNGCGGLTSVTIANGVTSIGSGAFAGCVNEGFTSITIPGSVTSIGNGAFQNCNGLTKAVIENGVKEIAVDMFEGCHKLESVEIPQSVDSIGSGAFKNCSSLKEVNSLDGVKNIGSMAFQFCHGLESITIPTSVETIGEAAFAGSGLRTVKITEGVKYIVQGAFQGCGNLTHMEIPKSVKSIGYHAFFECNSFMTIIFAGTQAEWDKITNGVDIGLGDKTVTCLGN